MLDWLCACQRNTGLRLQEGSKKPIAQKHGGKLSLGGQGTILHRCQARSGSGRYHLVTEIVLCKIVPRHRNLLFSKKWPKESDQRGLLIWDGRTWKGVVGEGQQLTFYSGHKNNVSPFLFADS